MIEQFRELLTGMHKCRHADRASFRNSGFEPRSGVAACPGPTRRSEADISAWPPSARSGRCDRRHKQNSPHLCGLSRRAAETVNRPGTAH